MNHLDQSLLCRRTGNLQVNVARGQQHGEYMAVSKIPIQQQSAIAHHLTPQNGRSPTEIDKVHIPFQQVAQVKASYKHILDWHWPGNQCSQIYVRIDSRLAPSLRAE